MNGRTETILFVKKTALAVVLLVCLPFSVLNYECFADTEYESENWVGENLEGENSIGDNPGSKVYENEREILAEEILTEEELDDGEHVFVSLNSNQDADELFEEYQNSVLFENIPDSNLVEQGEMVLEIQKQYSVPMAAPPSSSGYKLGDRLSEYQKPVYDAITEFIQDVADGKVSETVVTIVFDKKSSYNSGERYVSLPSNYFSFKEMNNAETAADAKRYYLDNNLNFKKIYDAVLYDNPYLLYWHDKVKGCVMSSSVMNVANKNQIHVKSITLSFNVSVDYSNGEYTNGRLYNTNPELASMAKNAANKAAEIVASHAGESDYDKLCAYRDYICANVSYNTDVSTMSAYGDPWQLIYVFDEDPNTNVVCEGYSKAFKYLCDLSTFNTNIECLLMGGYISTGYSYAGHMWNIVRMGDGGLYLVDITNSDSGNVWSGCLFLVGYSEIKEDAKAANYQCSTTGYKFERRGSQVIYFAFQKMEDYYIGSEELQFPGLKLSESDYELHVHNFIDGYCSECDTYQYGIKVKLEGCSLEVGSNYVLNLYISDAGSFASKDNSYIVMQLPGEQEKRYAFANADTVNMNGKKMYVFSYNVGLNKAAEKIDVSFYTDDNLCVWNAGANRGTSVRYSVSVGDYAKSFWESDASEKQKKCLRALFEFSDSIQKYTGYAGQPAADVLVNQPKGVSRISDNNMLGFINKMPVKVNFYGTGKQPLEIDNLDLEINNAVALKVYVKSDENATLDEYKYSINGRETSLKQDENGLYFIVEGIHPTEFSKSNLIKISDASGSDIMDISVRATDWTGQILKEKSGTAATVMDVARYIYYLGRYGKN